MKRTAARPVRLLLLFLAGVPLDSSATPAGEPAPCVDRPPLHLAPGEQRLLHTEGLVRFSIGSDSVARALPRPGGSANTILLKAVGPGVSDLWIQTGRSSCELRPIQVHAVDPKATPVIPPELGRLLSRLEEVEVHATGAGAFLRGMIRTPGEAATVEKVRSLFAEKITDETTLSPELLEAAFTKLESAVSALSPPIPLEVAIAGGRIEIRGNLENAGEQRSLMRALRAAFPLFDWRVEALPGAGPTLSIKVYLLEVRRNRFGGLGIDWPADWGAGVRAFPLSLGGADSFEIRLKALSGEGAARILSEPEIAVRAPGQAELFSGGELPVRTTRRRDSQVDWRPFGLSLKLKVEKATGTQVRLDIETEMSALDAATQDQALPRMQTNRLRTQVDGTFGIPLLLTGLVQQSWRDSARGLPGLRSLPVLGSLFESEEYLNHQSELVAVLVPRATPSEAPMERFQDGRIPQGPRPAPRNYLSPEEERAMRSSPGFPWNAFNDRGAQ